MTNNWEARKCKLVIDSKLKLTSGVARAVSSAVPYLKLPTRVIDALHVFAWVNKVELRDVSSIDEKLSVRSNGQIFQPCSPGKLVLGWRLFEDYCFVT